MKPHKHAELIKAWADGAEIERCGIGSLGPWTLHDGAWDVAENYDFRIKQEPKPDYEETITLFRNCAVSFLTMDVDSRWLSNHAYYKPFGNFKITLDGETGKIKKVEVL